MNAEMKDDFSKTEFAGALTEVRKAYRLLYVYQDRILKLMRYVGSYYGIAYHGGFNAFSSHPPRKGKGTLGEWAWDWLGFYHYEFLFIVRKKSADQSEDLFFCVSLQSDTGLYDHEEKNEIRDHDNKKLDFNNYEEANESRTRLVFMIAKVKDWDPCKMFVENKWHGKKKDEEELELLKDDKCTMFGKAYNLESFCNKAATDGILKQFKERCGERGFKFPELDEGLAKAANT